MPLLKPDPTFYPSPRLAAQGPPEKLGYVAALNPPGSKHNDAMIVVDFDPASADLLDRKSDAARCPISATSCIISAGTPVARRFVPTRRILISNGATSSCPGFVSSRIYVIDTKPDPREPKIVRTIEPEEVAARTGYSRPHTVHCGPEGIYVSALGSPSGDGPGGIFLLDHFTFDVLGQWEVDRGDQYLHYDFWWHLLHDTLLSSEWGTPEHDRERSATRPADEVRVRPSHARLGSAPEEAHRTRSIWVRKTRWCWRCARRMIRRKTYGFVSVVVSTERSLGLDLVVAPA